MTSYITADELLNFYPLTSDYAPEQITIALNTSFSLVNSFIDSSVPTPVSTTPVPGILKIVQSRFAQYVLEHTNNGWSQELQNLFDSTAEMCRKLGANELLISEISTTAQELGWNIISSTLSTTGRIFVAGESPELETYYTFENTVSGLNYVADTQWDVTRSDSSTVLYTITGDYDWQDVDGYLSIRFDGQFTGGETFIVKGVPITSDIKSTSPVIKQSTIYY